MTPQQFKQARHTLGLSTAQLGTILDTNDRTVRKWEHDDGTRPPNPIACRVLEWMLAGYRPPEFPYKKSEIFVIRRHDIGDYLISPEHEWDKTETSKKFGPKIFAQLYSRRCEAETAIRRFVCISDEYCALSVEKLE